MPQQQLKVMISSTARDLPEHRKELVEACLRQDAFPLRMEDLPANSEEAAAVSLNMVEDADVYIGVFANRYGYVPKTSNPTEISVTEMEYNRAVERKIERLIFIMDKSHPITVDDVEIENVAKLKSFKERVGAENIVKFFKSPADLRAEAINSLSKLRQPDLTTFHYVSDIPTPPEAFIAHPYTLLQTPTLIGRKQELKLLTDWITGKDLEFDGRKVAGNSVRIMSIVAIGGLGKSALTWKWFNDIAPEEMKLLAGRMWWSFYESDATFENFVTRALAYLTKRPLDEVRQIPAPEREIQLLAVLNREPFLIVLDGLERILIAYARMDASRLDDSQVGKEKSLRKTTDPRVGSFLKKLAQLKNSRVLVSSRLYPAELETDGGDPIPGSFRCNITGLTDEDAVELWRAFGVSGSRDELLPVFSTFGKHPLLIQALSGEVKRYHRAPGNFEDWRKANPQFDPSKFPNIQDAMAHVLSFALHGLDERAEKVLQTIAGFRMPTGYDALAAVLTGSGKSWADEKQLDRSLTQLEDRGLVGWDKRANRYDLHPIVRGVVWSNLGEDSQRGVYTSLHAHFEALPMVHNYLEVNSLEDLTPAMELYNTLIGLERYDDALRIFHDRLEDAMFWRLSAQRSRVELLEMLFPDGLAQLPKLSSTNYRVFTLNALAQGYHYGGQPGRAAPFYRQVVTISTEINDHHGLSILLGNLSITLQELGALRDSLSASCRGLIKARDLQNLFWEGNNLAHFGSALARRGVLPESKSAFARSLRILAATHENQVEGAVTSLFAQSALGFGDFAEAHSLGTRAWELAHIQNLERDLIRAARVQGEAALGLRDLNSAEERLHHALTRARMVNFTEEELPSLVALAELRRRQGDLEAARALLADVWEAAERGPYPLFHADACNVLAQIERDEGNTAAAIEAATKAYRLAWCDGPPFAYHWGLEKAKQHLKELGAPEPELPPFDESKFEPMPQVEIDPDDEFHVGHASDTEAVL